MGLHILKDSCVVQRSDVYDKDEMQTYIIVQQSGSVNSSVATCSSVYIVDNPELCMA